MCRCLSHSATELKRKVVLHTLFRNDNFSRASGVRTYLHLPPIVQFTLELLLLLHTPLTHERLFLGFISALSPVLQFPVIVTNVTLLVLNYSRLIMK